MRTHIKKETKVGTTIFLRVLLFVGAIFRVLDVVVGGKNHVVENAKQTNNKVANADQNRPYNRYTDIGKLNEFLTKTTFSIQDQLITSHQCRSMTTTSI